MAVAAKKSFGQEVVAGALRRRAEHRFAKRRQRRKRKSYARQRPRVRRLRHEHERATEADDMATIVVKNAAPIEATAALVMLATKGSPPRPQSVLSKPRNETGGRIATR